MADFMIYAGLGLMLAAVVYGLIIAIKGFISRTKDGNGGSGFVSGFLPGNTTPQMRKFVRIWGTVVLTGLLLTAIGAIISL